MPVRIGDAMDTLPENARPASIARVFEIPLTEGFRPNKRAAGLALHAGLPRG